MVLHWYFYFKSSSIEFYPDFFSIIVTLPLLLLLFFFARNLAATVLNIFICLFSSPICNWTSITVLSLSIAAGSNLHQDISPCTGATGRFFPAAQTPKQDASSDASRLLYLMPDGPPAWSLCTSWNSSTPQWTVSIANYLPQLPLYRVSIWSWWQY